MAVEVVYPSPIIKVNTLEPLVKEASAFTGPRHCAPNSFTEREVGFAHVRLSSTFTPLSVCKVIQSRIARRNFNRPFRIQSCGSVHCVLQCRGTNRHSLAVYHRGHECARRIVPPDSLQSTLRGLIDITFCRCLRVARWVTTQGQRTLQPSARNRKQRSHRLVDVVFCRSLLRSDSDPPLSVKAPVIVPPDFLQR